MVYANDTAGNFGASENVAFNIVVKPEPFPITLAVTASGVAVAIAIAGIVLYFRKRNR
jgi:hypothetical protein